jgi:hypothetical protein
MEVTHYSRQLERTNKTTHVAVSAKGPHKLDYTNFSS